MADTHILVLKLKAGKYNKTLKKAVRYTKDLKNAQDSLISSNSKANLKLKQSAKNVKTLSKSYGRLTKNVKRSKQAFKSLSVGRRGGMFGGRGGIFGTLMGMGTLGTGAGVAAGIGLGIKLAKDAVKLANVQEIAEAKLEGALAAKGNTLQFTNRQLKDYAFRLSQITGVADESLIDVQAMLSTFTQVRGNVFKQAVPLIVDVSKVMRQDMKQSAIQLGKALNNPTKGLMGLRRIGIYFGKEQEKQIKNFMAMNDVVSAQKVILEQVNLELGKTSQLMGQTTSAKVDKLTNNFNNLSESFGNIIKLGTNLNQVLDKTNQLLEKSSTEVRNFVNGFGKLNRKDQFKEGFAQGMGFLFGAMGATPEMFGGGRAKARDQFDKEMDRRRGLTKSSGGGTGKAFNPDAIPAVPTFQPSTLVGNARVGSIGAARVANTASMRIYSQIERNTARTAIASEAMVIDQRNKPKMARDPNLAEPLAMASVNVQRVQDNLVY